MKLFDNWTRKLSIIAIGVWAFVVVWRVVVQREAVGLSDIATSVALIIGTTGAKSVASTLAAYRNAQPK